MERNSGFAFHVHHDRLVEFCTDYKERAAYIRENKPADEIELRLRLLKLIPLNRLPLPLDEALKAYFEALKACDEARKAYGEARKACDEARKACDEALKAYFEALKACDEAWKAYGEAGKACDEAWKAYGEAGKAYDEAWKACAKYFTKLHKELCPNCPWDGKTIFSKRRVK